MAQTGLFLQPVSALQAIFFSPLVRTCHPKDVSTLWWWWWWWWGLCDSDLVNNAGSI
jgi:hypothetical protein